MIGQVQVDWTVNIGHIMTILGFVIGGFSFAYSVRSDVNSLKDTEESNAKKIAELQANMKALSEATVTLARQDERMKGFERRLENLEGDVRIFTHPGTP